LPWFGGLHVVLNCCEPKWQNREKLSQSEPDSSRILKGHLLKNLHIFIATNTNSYIGCSSGFIIFDVFWQGEAVVKKNRDEDQGKWFQIHKTDGTSFSLEWIQGKNPSDK
jgi:hypothetical protein